MTILNPRLELITIWPSLDEQPLIGFHSWIFNIRTIDKAAPYVDGHERPDVAAHRNHFVMEMEEWKRRINVYVGDNMETCI